VSRYDTSIYFSHFKPFLFALIIDRVQNDEQGGLVDKADFHGLSPDAQIRSCASEDQAAAVPPRSLTNSRRLMFFFFLSD